MPPELLHRGGLRLEVSGPVATISLCRPEVRNAQTPRTWAALGAIADGLGDDVRAVLVRGEGRSFSAGLDRRLFDPSGFDGMPGITALAGAPAAEVDESVAGYQRAFTWLRDPARVTVAAVQGHAVGAGFQLALACDVRVLAEDAQLVMAETSHGIVPDLGGTLPLVQAVGYAAAVDICLTGRPVGAAEALRLGLASSVVPLADLDAAVAALLDQLLAAPDGAVRETLGLLAAAVADPDPAAQLARERAAQARRLRALAAPPA